MSSIVRMGHCRMDSGMLFLSRWPCNGARSIVQGLKQPSTTPVGYTRRGSDHVTLALWSNLGDFTWEPITLG